MSGTKQKVQKWRIGTLGLGVFIVIVLWTYQTLLFNGGKMTLPMRVFNVDEIDDMCHVAKFRIFADNYQFYICDPDRATSMEKMFGAVINMSTAHCERGWTRTSSAITCFTIQDLNDHRIDVFVGKEYDGHNGATRVLCQTLNLSCGRLHLFGAVHDETEIRIPPGDYSIYVRGFNFGVGIEEFIENNEEFLERSDMERYEIVLVPGTAAKEGIVFGPENLHDVISTHPNPLPEGQGTLE